MLGFFNLDKKGDNIVQTKHGNKTCAVLHLRIVVAVNHLSVIALHPIIDVGEAQAGWTC